LPFLSVAALGIFVGCMLTEGLVLVPYWRSLAAREFFSWYSANDKRLLGFFGPITTVAALLTVVDASAALWVAHPGRWFALAAALLSAVVVAMFPLYFQRANASFSAASIPASEVGSELARWAFWHWVRSGLSFAALAASLLAL